jgi:hypothetical protein
MGNRKNARLTFYSPPGPGKRQKHEHLCYSTTSDGQLMVSTSFVAPELPSKANSQDDVQPDSLDLDESLDENDYEPLDPAYLEHLAQMSIEESIEPTKRRRTAAVRIYYVTCSNRLKFDI